MISISFDAAVRAHMLMIADDRLKVRCFDELVGALLEPCDFDNLVDIIHKWEKRLTAGGIDD